ncbi:MAG: cytochrome c [Candidatus Acidiferrales bacterium]
MIKGLVIGCFLAAVIFARGFFYYFASGMAPVATADPPMPFEKKLANISLDAHIEKQHVAHSPVAADEPTFLAGADVYIQHCAACHGLPGQLPTDYAATMYPKPTQLFQGKGVSDDPATESYWKAANGIRLSGMPAFKTKLTDTQLWQVSELVAHSNEISESVKKLLVQAVATAASGHEPTAK